MCRICLYGALKMTFNFVCFADACRVLKNQTTKSVLNFWTSIFDSQIIEIRDLLPLFNFSLVPSTGGDTRWRSWLRLCATSRKVAGSIPDGVIGIFHWQNPSGRKMALGSTQFLTEMSTRNISWGVKAAGAWTDNHATFMCRLSWNLGAWTSWNP